MRDAFWDKAQVEGECWVWRGHRNRRGVGQVQVGSRVDGSRRKESAHRMAWRLARGAIPDGLTVDQDCGNRGCVRPEHLRLLMPGRPHRDVDVRFDEKTIPEPNSGCLLWTGTTSNDGYGRFRPRGRSLVGAHRFAWEREHGPAPDGLHVLHKCDTPACVNVDHLFLGTHQENMDDMRAKGRAVFLRGAASGRALLTEDLVRELRARRAAGETCAALAREIGMSAPGLGHALTGRNWSWLDGAQ